MKNLLTFALLGSIAIGAEGCKPENKEAGDGALTVDPQSLSFTTAGGTEAVMIDGKNWSATTSDEWIEIQERVGIISVTVGANTLEEELVGQIVISNNSDSKTITVTQEALGGSELSVDATRLEFPHSGGTKTVLVTAERPWVATPSNDWITITPKGDGTGFDVTLGLTTEVETATPEELNGSIVVSNGVASQDKTISVWQALGVQSIIMFPHNATLLYPDGAAQLEVFSLVPVNATDKRVVWASLDESIVTVDQSGNLTPVSVGTATVTVSTVDIVDTTGQPATDECLVIVAQPWTPGTVSFRSENIWTITLADGVSKRQWSDTVLSSNADKDEYTGVSGDTYIADAMRNGSYGHMFSWKAVDDFGATLCPAPWRVPTMDDFVDLDKALGGTGENFQSTSGQEDRYRNEWGLEWAGQAFNSRLSGSGENDRASSVSYWSATDNSNVDARALGVTDNHELGGTPHPAINPKGIRIKQYGYLLRCVKNAE